VGNSSKALNYGNNSSTSGAVAVASTTMPPANFGGNLRQCNLEAAGGALLPSQLLPERIQTAVSMAEYRSR